MGADAGAGGALVALVRELLEHAKPARTVPGGE
ncbi:hypothetical protein RKD38_005246 [Streptomyces ambofaciens]